MTYQVLARKWRPQNFSDLVGQEHVVKALVNALESGRVHHAYLFTGTRGVGKTTIARIFAKSLNCENGVSAEPCGTCSVCQDIMAGRFFDLIEVDAASNTGVDDTRELLENAQYKPTSGRYKVYLIDEVHMFSKSSFNALLKTLEEPPEHVKFLLATTEQQRLPATVLSRCLQFNLKSMPQSLLTEHLSNILTAEKIEFEERALAQVAKVADGSVRDSLSLVEQVAALGEGAVKSSVVENLLGVLSSERVLDLVRSIAAGDAEKSLSLVAGMAEFSPDYSQLLADLLSILHHIAMQQMVPGAAAASPDWPADALTEASSSLSPEEVQLFYQIALQGQRDMPYAPQPRQSFEMTVLRMLHFRPVSSTAAGGASGGGHSEAAAVAEKKTEKAAGNLASGVTPPTQAEAPPPSRPAAVVEAVTAVPESLPVSLPVASAGNAALAKSQASASATDGQPSTDALMPCAKNPSTTAAHSVAENNLQPMALPTPDTWNDLVDRLEINGAGFQLARNSSLTTVEQHNGLQSIILNISQPHEELKVARDYQRFERALSAICQQPVKLVINTGEHQTETLAQRNERLRLEAQHAAEASIAADPIVKRLLERVDGELEQASITPVAQVAPVAKLPE